MYLGKYEDAKKVLQEAVHQITTSVSVGEEFCQGLLSDLTNASATMKSHHEYKSHGAHYMMSKYVHISIYLSIYLSTYLSIYLSISYRMQSHAVQRSNYLSEETPYSNASRSFYVEKSKGLKKK